MTCRTKILSVSQLLSKLKEINTYLCNHLFTSSQTQADPDQYCTTALLHSLAELALFSPVHIARQWFEKEVRYILLCDMFCQNRLFKQCSKWSKMGYSKKSSFIYYTIVMSVQVNSLYFTVKQKLSYHYFGPLLLVICNKKIENYRLC